MAADGHIPIADSPDWGDGARKSLLATQEFGQLVEDDLSGGLPPAEVPPRVGLGSYGPFGRMVFPVRALQQQGE